MKANAFFVCFIAIFTELGFSQIPPNKERFYQNLFMHDSDITGLQVDTASLSNLDVFIKNIYVQKFGIAGVTGQMYLVLFNSNKDALDTAQIYRGDVACFFNAGLWNEFNGKSIGDSCWHG